MRLALCSKQYGSMRTNNRRGGQGGLAVGGDVSRSEIQVEINSLRFFNSKAERKIYSLTSEIIFTKLPWSLPKRQM